MEQGLPGRLDGLLLEAATTLGGELEVEGLALRLQGILPAISNWCLGGIIVYDDERETLLVYSFKCPASSGIPEAERGAIASYEVPGADSRSSGLAKADVFVSADLRHEPAGPLVQRMRDAGVRRFVSAPMLLGARLLGGVFLGFSTSGQISEDVRMFVQLLARIVTPVLWNCHTHARFGHGDRRRDALIELGDAINKSLRLQTVLDSARHAIQGLAGHCFSSIDLLKESGAAYLSYRCFTPAQRREVAAGEPASVPLAGTALEWVLQNGRTHQSEDLADRRQFVHDAELRDLGVRRYVATPMIVRGRVIGSLLMGSADPHRTLGVDVWLYENIALQLALAVDNARQLGEVRRLSDRLAQQNVYLREEIQKEHDFSEMILCEGDILEVDEPAAGGSRAALPRESAPEAAILRMSDMEAGHIRKALGEAGGVIEGPNGAARLLGIKPSTLRFRMKRLGIQRCP